MVQVPKAGFQEEKPLVLFLTLELFLQQVKFA